jgi:hypothetical protein
MEGVPQPTTIESGWDAWDTAPSEGPAVFVVHTRAYDEGRIVGRWIDPRQPLVEIERQIAELVGGELEAGSWVVIDQVQLGEPMVPESPTVAELGAIAAAHAIDQPATML